MNLRHQQKQHTRAVIRDTAYALFEEKGYQRATMRELASRAGIALGTIFQHFPDKPSLLFAVFTDDMEAVIDEGFATLPAGSLRDQLLHLVAGIFRFYGERPELSRILVKESLFPEGEWAQRLERSVLAFLARVGPLVEAAQARGELPQELDLRDTLASFWAHYFMCLVGALRTPEFDGELALDQLGRLLDHQLSAWRAVTPESE